MAQGNEDLAPETVNSEQEDASMQAQQVAAEALQQDAACVLGLQQSRKRTGGLTDADEQDLVDHMRQMTSSGMIDMSAYAGEEAMDDLEDRFGRDTAADEKLASDDS